MFEVPVHSESRTHQNDANTDLDGRVTVNLLTPKEFAEQRGVTVQALAAERHKGTGPKFVKLGSRVFYRPEDIDAWIDSNVYSRTDRKASA